VQWFDGHLDLAYIADHGRDLSQNTGGGPPDEGGTASVSFPSLRAANVRAAVSTIFVRRRVPADPARRIDAVEGPYCFDTDDEAFSAALRQLDMHAAWEARGEMTVIRDNQPGTRDATLPVVLAIEGASCLRTPEDLDRFHAAGVRVVSLAWAEGNRYSGGDASGGDITPAGRALVDRIDALGLIHDVSHLSERAFWTLLESARGTIIASHSNARALLPSARVPERHLSDDQIRALAAHPGALIGINLFARFILPPDELKERRATIADLVRHLEHIAQVAGRRSILALGSDFDSGFGPELLPIDLQGPAHLPRLADALSAAGWSDADIATFTWRNWSRLLRLE
jgi:membrane dipeptidase